MESHRAFEPADLPWPELDDLSLARLRAIPIWTLALEIEIDAGVMLSRFAQSEPDPLVRQAIELQGYEEDRHGRILQCMISKYGLTAKPDVVDRPATRRAFIKFGYSECLDSFAGFGIFRLAREARLVPESLTSVFSPVIAEEARHIVFFVNWVAWDRYRRGLRNFALQAPAALMGYAAAIGKHVKDGRKMAAQQSEPKSGSMDLFADAMKGLTPATFIRACVEENERYMASFDPRLLRPRVVPALGNFALTIFETIDRLRASSRKESPRSLGSG
ncbi:MAG TPA: hypothetical protein VHR97_05370 [Candidatus Baltobacteraceae bacterium]|nr:hypothetical protein [Candidatus Baltobacteraceae bacterium]